MSHSCPCDVVGHARVHYVAWNYMSCGKVKLYYFSRNLVHCYVGLDYYEARVIALWCLELCKQWKEGALLLLTQLRAW